MKRDNALLRQRVAQGGGKTPLEQLLEHPDLAPSTKKTVLALTAKMQDVSAHTHTHSTRREEKLLLLSVPPPLDV